MAENFPVVFLSFVAYSFLGWCCETAYCSILQKKFVNRGFLAGPVCPVYGFGAMAVILLLSRFHSSVLLVFLLGALVASGVEYLCGWLLETIFHAKWWDYSSYRFNLHGRVCLLNSTMFGILSVVAVCGLHPQLLKLLEKVPLILQWLLTIVAGGYFVTDTIVTSKEILALNGKLVELDAIADEAQLRIRAYRHQLKAKLEEMEDKLEERGGELEERLQHLEERLSGLLPELPDLEDAEEWLDDKLPDREELEEAFRMAMEKLEARLDALEQRKGSVESRLLRAFPNLRSHQHPKAFEKLRELRDKKKK